MPLLSLWASRSCCQPVTDEDISHIHIKGRFYGPFWMNFQKTSEGGGGSFPIQNILLQIFLVILRGKTDDFLEKGG